MALYNLQRSTTLPHSDTVISFTFYLVFMNPSHASLRKQHVVYPFLYRQPSTVSQLLSLPSQPRSQQLSYTSCYGGNQCKMSADCFPPHLAASSYIRQNLGWLSSIKLAQKRHQIVLLFFINVGQEIKTRKLHILYAISNICTWDC